MDAIATAVVGDDPQKIPHLIYLNNDGMGCADVNKIKVWGTQVNAIKKNFPHKVNSTQSDATDFSAPQCVLKSVKSNGKTLSVELENTSDVSKVELEFNGIQIPQIITGNFENIAFDISKIKPNKGDLNILIQDRLLNTQVLKYKLK